MVSRFSGVFLLIMYVQLLIFQVSRGLLDDTFPHVCVCLFHAFSSACRGFANGHQLFVSFCLFCSLSSVLFLIFPLPLLSLACELRNQPGGHNVLYALV